MESDLSKIEFYFPEGVGTVKNKQSFVDLIIEKMSQDGSIDYSGYANKKALNEGIMSHLGKGILEYEVISENQKRQITDTIQETILKCNNLLKIPTKNYVFVFPFFPNEDYKMFNGVMGVAVYSCVLNIFLSLKLWSPKVLANSIAHEINHTVFYYNHFNNFNNYNLLDELVMEGLAENFRECAIDSERSPWSSALNETESFLLLDSLKDKFSSRERSLIEGLLFGDKKYKRWSGYSVGYWLVKRFIEKNNSLTWDEIMKKESIEIFNSAMK